MIISCDQVPDGGILVLVRCASRFSLALAPGEDKGDQQDTHSPILLIPVILSIL
jgi:hypothetical protein